MRAIRRLLDESLQAAGVAEPDGRLLYQYPITETPADQVRMASLVHFLKHRLITDETLDRDECAAFCFTLARKGVPVMADAAVTWNRLLSSALCLSRDDIPAAHNLQAYTDTGLGWWKRRLIRIPRSVRYLSSLWCEGGGPLNWMLRDFGTFRSFFREVLRVHAEFPMRDLDSVIYEEQYRLPETLRHATVRDMTREAVRETARLRDRLLGVKVVAQHLSWLDANEPGWRNRWPFPLEDELALEFVRSAISEPREATRDHDTIGIKVTLESSACGLVLKRSLSLPKSLTEGRVAELSRAPGEDLPPQQWWKLVVACREYEVAKLYRPRPAAPFIVAAAGNAAVTGQAAAQRATLVCRRGAREVFSTCDLPGNDSLSEGLWVFEESPGGKPARFVGGGSYSTAGGSLLLVVPIGTTIAEGPDLINIGFVVGTEPVRSVFRLTGNRDIESEDGTVTLTVNSPEATSLRFSLLGQSRTLGAYGSDVWLGLPALCECGADGTFHRLIADDEIQWRAAGEAEWHRITARDECLGDIRLRCVREGQGVVYRQRITVLPKNAKVSFRGKADSPLTGIVHLRNLGVPHTSISLASVDSGRHISINGAGALVAITIQDDDRRERSPTFRCRISWGEPRRAEVAIGVPVHDVVIIDAAGRRCIPPGPIPIGLLDGLSLRATFPDQCEPVLVDGDNDIWASLIPDEDGGATFSLPLSSIAARARGYLAISDQIDGFLPLYVRRESHIAHQQTVIRITHTAGQVTVTEADVGSGRATLMLSEELGNIPWLGHQRNLELRRITDFDEPVSADAVQETDDATWLVDRTVLPTEGILAVVRGAGGVCLSPRYLPRQPAAPPIAVPVHGQIRFKDVVRIEKEQSRFAACCQLLNSLSMDLGNPDWECIDDLFDHAMDLPAPTFNFVSAIAGQPLVAALCALRVAGGNPRFWIFMEQLKFLWSMVPIATWLHAIRMYRAHLAATAPDSISDVLGAFCFSACRTVASLHPVVSLIRSNYTDIAFEPGPGAGDLGDRGIGPFDANEAKLGVQRMFARLCGEHQGVWWPEEGVVIGKRTQDAIGICALHDIARYTKAVVYAPFQAAARMAYGVPTTPQEIVRLIRCRAFDADWYDPVQQLMTYYLISRRVTEDPETYHPK